MNRPRNRQQRPPRNDDRGHNERRGPPQGGASASNNVPTIQQVIPGASVSIVLKADQPTGREVQGVVQDLLTRGNHPRGIKVRLQDGRIGRVQRMAGTAPAAASAATMANPAKPTAWRFERDVRLDEDEFPSMPPARGLADFMPSFGGREKAPTHASTSATFASASAKCPVCGVFEGDEVAVSRHVEEHFK